MSLYIHTATLWSIHMVLHMVFEDTTKDYPCVSVHTSCIAAVDQNYNKMTTSDYGSKIDFVAPGKSIGKFTIHSARLLY